MVCNFETCFPSPSDLSGAKKLPTSQADEFYSNKMKTVIKDNNYGKVITADPYNYVFEIEK